MSMSVTERLPNLIPGSTAPPSQHSAVSWEDSPSPRGDGQRVISLFAPAPSLDMDAFVHEGYGRERFYWSEPGGDAHLTIAAQGIATAINVAPILSADISDLTNGDARLPSHRFAETAAAVGRLFDQAIVRPTNWTDGSHINSAWDNHPARPRLFGGFAFQDDFVPDNTWSTFSPVQFVLPHYQLVRVGAEQFLTINALVSREDNLADSLRGLREALSARLAYEAPHVPHPLRLTDIRYPMSAEMWAEIIGQAIQAIKSGAIEKVVLSRVCEVKTAEPIDVAATLAYLESHYADSYRFIFEPTPLHAFFGATPELLVRKDGRRVETMALAGSGARGQDEAEDETLGRQLLTSVKDRHEHQLVVDAIRRHLADWADDVIIPDQPALLKLRNIQHLLTPILGALRDPQADILDLVRQLHPTPAMGGVPATKALAFLQQAESVPRGWYAAPIGWLDAHRDGVFAVAIRSAVTQYSRAWLYAGAGIVADSEPDREWAETALKFRPMLGALGIGGPAR